MENEFIPRMFLTKLSQFVIVALPCYCQRDGDGGVLHAGVIYCSPPTNEFGHHTTPAKSK